MKENKLLHKILEYFVVTITSLFIMGINLHIWTVDLRVPISCDGDSLYFCAMTKSIMESNFLWQNEYLAAPFSSNFYDFPAMGCLDMWTIKLLGLIIKDWAIVINVYYIASFPLIACIAYMVLKRFSINKPIAGMLAVLYSVLPYHFMRGQWHLNLTNYCFVPVTFLIIFFIFQQCEDDGDKKLLDTKINTNMLTKKLILLSCLLGFQVAYYSFFSLIMVILGGVILQILYSKSKALKASMISTFTICICTFISLSPGIIWNLMMGKNDTAILRGVQDFNVYSLKISQLFAPVNGHRIAMFNKISERIMAGLTLQPNETSMSSLGLLISIGFCLTYLLLILYKTQNKRIKFLNVISLINIFIVSIGTFGGFGFFIYALFKSVRCYNRVSIYIAFISIIVLGILADELKNKINNKKIINLLLIIIFTLSLFDVSSINFINQQYAFKDDFNSMKQYIKIIESELNDDDMVYYLPYNEGVPLAYPMTGNIAVYDPYKPYLFSDKIKWSYGGTNGRDNDLLTKSISKLDLEGQINAIYNQGFKGVLVDKNGYLENFDSTISLIEKITLTKPIVSKDGRYYFYKLKNLNPVYASANQIKYGVIEGAGFYGQESNEDSYWNWGKSKATLIILNYGNKDIDIDFKAQVVISDNQSNKISIEKDKKNMYEGVGQSQNIYLKLVLHPGINKLKFETNARKVKTDNDPRQLYFALFNPKIELSK